jgi:4-carboxymuconolactone decarboxylase
VVYKLKDNRFVGPFGAQLHTPGAGQHFLGMAKAIAQIPGLNPRNREIAIITTGAKFNAAYELYAHKVLGEMKGISPQEYDEILKGKRPESFDEEAKAVYDVAHKLVVGSGPLSRGAWDKAVELLTKDGATAVVQYVGFYSYVCMILRGFDCKIPNVED